MVVRSKTTLLPWGKLRTQGCSADPWRVRLYAPEAGSTKYQVMFRAPAGVGEMWKRVLRRANSEEEEARKIFAQAEAALPRSLMEGELLPRVKELLNLPGTASLQQVVNAQEAERQRRAALAERSKDRNLAWWNYPVPPEDELWLFVDTDTGLPATPELHNDRWHRIRKWVETHDPDNAWPKTIVYRNLRHHAAAKWFHDELGEPWEVVAQYLGDKLTTVLNHYVRAGEDALRDSVSRLATR